MRLLLLNPNTSATMTAAMLRSARAVAVPPTLLGRQPSFGPVSIESHFDEVFGAAGVAEQMRLAAGESFNAALIACFGDPSLDAARELTRAPALGVAADEGRRQHDCQRIRHHRDRHPGDEQRRAQRARHVLDVSAAAVSAASPLRRRPGGHSGGAAGS